MCNYLALKLHTRGKQGEKLCDHIFHVIRNQRNLEKIKQRDTTRIYFLAGSIMPQHTITRKIIYWNSYFRCLDHYHFNYHVLLSLYKMCWFYKVKLYQIWNWHRSDHFIKINHRNVSILPCSMMFVFCNIIDYDIT